MCGKKKELGPKYFGSKKSKKNIDPKKHIGSNQNFMFQKHFESKKSWVQEKFG